MSRRQRNDLTLLPSPPLLKSESIDEFDAIQQALATEIEPHGIIEDMYLADVGAILWEILRLRRCKSVIINAGFRPALENILVQLLRAPSDLNYSVRNQAEDIAVRWFSDPEIKKQVREILNRFGLDESAIEAEAIRISSADLERLDRMLMSLEKRRDKALRCIGEYRDALARRLKESSDRIIEAKGALELEDGSSVQSSAA